MTMKKLQPTKEQGLDLVIKELEKIATQENAPKMFDTTRHPKYDVYFKGNKSGLIFLALQLLKAANMKISKQKDFTMGNCMKNKQQHNFHGSIELLNANDKVELFLKRNPFLSMAALIMMILLMVLMLTQ